LSRSRIKLVTSALVATATLAGCSDIYLDRRETISLSAGDALRTNQVVHMVDPWPAHSANRDIAFDGQKMQSAVERYRTNRVIRPVSATTSTAGYDTAAPAVAIKP
jgi:hypothetical protein